MNARAYLCSSAVGAMTLTLSLGACQAPNEPSGDETTASVEMAFSGVDFSNNSVFITAIRSTPADPKYPCKSYASACFEFDSAGHPIDSTTYSNGFEDLCPTADVDSYGNPGTWTFKYEIWTKPGCGAYGGVVLNDYGNPNNFVCFDHADILAQDYPNKTVGEVLDPGITQLNTIICYSANTDKAFDFNSCEILANDPGYYVKLDCGCYPDGYGGCDCGQFDTLDDLPYECEADPYKSCNIVCHN